MKSLNLQTYLVYAIYIVRTNPAILGFIAAFGLLNGATVYFPEGGFLQLLNTLTILAAIFISPVIYGIYYEVVEEKYSSIPNIFRTYVGGYLLVLFSMYIPIIMTTAVLMSAMQSGTNTGAIMLTILLFSMLFIYVIPTYYISGKILGSIAFGVRFFITNILSSAPLLLMALASELLLLLSHFQLEGVRESAPALFVALDFSLYMLASIIDFILFIMLIYILKNEDMEPR